MRVIKFRGKRLDNGEWVRGCYLSNPLQDRLHSMAIYSGQTNGWLTYEVNPATVGQFTGLKDVNGTEIWEGDVVTFDEKSYEVVFAKGRFMATRTFVDGKGKNHVVEATFIAENIEHFQVEVTTNIHDK